jgi:hypothetical protein
MGNNKRQKILDSAEHHHRTLYSGCQKNVPLSKRFFLQPLMAQSFIPEHFHGKGYNLPIDTWAFGNAAY